jgi:hypothetical protein
MQTSGGQFCNNMVVANVLRTCKHTDMNAIKKTILKTYRNELKNKIRLQQISNPY